MARTITNSMSEILQALELESETYITNQRLGELAEKYGIKTSPALIAYRLKEAGWLIPTPQQGVWEFAPASYAGTYSKNDPLRSVKAFRLANSEAHCFLCMQTAAWAMGVADRIPSITEVAFSEMPSKHIPKQMHAYHYRPNLEPLIRKEVPCLAPESILIQMTAKPSLVRSWESVFEWLPDLVYELDPEKIMQELQGRPNSVKQRTGYLLQNMFPEAAESIRKQAGLHAKVRFGPRDKAIRNDESWMISDTVLPVSPKEMEKVK